MDRVLFCWVFVMWSGIWFFGCLGEKKGFFFINLIIGRYYFIIRVFLYFFFDYCFILNNGFFFLNFEFK